VRPSTHWEKNGNSVGGAVSSENGAPGSTLRSVIVVVEGGNVHSGTWASRLRYPLVPNQAFRRKLSVAILRKSHGSAPQSGELEVFSIEMESHGAMTATHTVLPRTRGHKSRAVGSISNRVAVVQDLDRWLVKLVSNDRIRPDDAL